MAHAIIEVDRPAAQAAARPDADRRPRGRDRAAAGGASTWRACGSCRSSSSSASPASASRGSCRSCGRSRSGSSSSTEPASSTPRPSRSARCGRRSASSSASRPTAARAEAGAMLQPFVTGMMPDLAPWLPLLAIPFDAEVDATPETVGARSCREPRQAPLDRRDVPRADPDDADAPRDRGRSLARRRLAVPARASRPAARDAPVARVRDDAAGRRPDRAGGRPQHAARARAARRSGRRGARDRRRVAVRPLDRSGRRARGPVGRQPALRPRARVRRAARCDRSTSCRRRSRAC